jgi:hypothetical protein
MEWNKRLHDKVIFENSSEPKCEICRTVCYRPTLCHYCESMYCLTCIAEWLSRSEQCPHCKKSLIVQSLKQSIIVQHALDNLKVTCGNFGCEWKGSYSEIMNHLPECSMMTTELREEASKAISKYNTR